GKSCCAHERRRLFDNGAHIGRDGQNMMRSDEAHEPVEGRAKRIHQLAGCGMLLSQVLQHGAWFLGRLEFVRNLPEVILVLAHVGSGDLEELVQWNVHHLVVLQLCTESLSTNAKVAV